MTPRIILFISVVLIFFSFSPAYAQHHSGDLAPPIDFDGLKVALITLLSPEDFNLEDAKSALLSIRFFDSDTNVNIKSVTYRVQIFQNGNLLANEYFFDEDGKLELEIRPTTGCKEEILWKCTKYFGEKHAIAGAYYARGDLLPIIQGPVFDKSGKYDIKVSIVGATNPKTMTTKDLLFETFLHVPKKETFLINTANAQEFPVYIKSYEGEILNFKYDEPAKKISYELFYQSDHHQTNSNIIQIISLKKEFLEFNQDRKVEVFIDGIKLKDDFFEFNVSSTAENIVRINIPHEELVLIEKKLYGDPNKDSIKIEIVPGDKLELYQLEFNFENNIAANASWDSQLKPGKKTTIKFSFFDVNKNPLKGTLFAYSVIDNDGKEVWSNIGNEEAFVGILAADGVTQDSILLPSNGKYQLKLILTGHNSKNYENFLTSKSDFSIPAQSLNLEEQTLRTPSWIKNNAGWWSKNLIDDDSFIQGIQWLIKEGVMQVSPTESTLDSSTKEIPSWIKNNAGWWADGLISEDDFLKGVEFLISKGIIRIN